MGILKTRRRYSMCGGDYSSQEVKVFQSFCKDDSMKEVFQHGRDLYSTVASMVYNLPYDECREFRQDGSFNLEGKRRRNNCKSLVLGILYGRGTASIAEQIKSHPGPVTKEDKLEAKDLTDKFFKQYPKAKAWIDQTHAEVKKNEYVEDLWGRRRRLPDINLPKYEIKKVQDQSNFNPLLGTQVKEQTVDQRVVSEYTKRLDKQFSKEQRQVITAEALQAGYEIKCNSGFIAQAERQSVNSRIQGSSATMSKIAMRNMYRDDELKKMDFHLLIPVHDEVIGEAPIYYIDKAKARMQEIMTNAGKPECDILMKVDADDFQFWYQDVQDAHIKEEYEEAISKGLTHNEQIDQVWEINCEFERDYIEEAIKRMAE